MAPLVESGGMFKTGLVSVTFRKLKPAEIITLAGRAAIDGIEWGGDVHVPHGDVKQARMVAHMTADAGLTVACYGSYYRLGAEPGTEPPFTTVLESALALGAPSIRVWPGMRSSAEADDAYRAQVVEEALQLAETLKPHGIKLVYEFHGNTLTDTAASATALLEATRHPLIHTLWQPVTHTSVEENLQGLRQIRERLLNLHVFQWQVVEGQRIKCALSEGTDAWQSYLWEAGAFGGDGWCLLEFVRDESPDQFLRDAATLRGWLRK